jgi:GDP-L-fucose synthase
MDTASKIYVAGHRGLVGSALCRKLESSGYRNVVSLSRRDLDLCDQRATREFFENQKPDYVFLAAAKVGGIYANSSQPAQFIHDNLSISVNVLEAARLSGVRKLLYLGSSCIYPRMSPQPIPEDALLTGSLEPSNSSYAIAKIAGLKMCDAYNQQYGTNFLTTMPTNLYGPNDNFDLETSHVLPALLRKCHDAKTSQDEQMVVWGSGTPRREFLHVDDLADACVFLMQNSNAGDLDGHVNIGTGVDVSIRELTELIQKIVGYRGDLAFDASKPDGTPRKLLNVDKIGGLGWKARKSLEVGIKETYEWYLSSLNLPQGAS